MTITVAPKGFGSENMTALKMFTPSATQRDVEDFIVEAVDRAGSNPLPAGRGGRGSGRDPPIWRPKLAKRALLRPLDQSSPDPYYADMGPGCWSG